MSRLTNEQKLGVMKSLRKVVNMKLRVSKIKKGSMEPLTNDEEFKYEYEDEEEQVVQDSQPPTPPPQQEQEEEEVEVEKPSPPQITEKWWRRPTGILVDSGIYLLPGKEFWNALRNVKENQCSIEEGQRRLEEAIRQQKHFTSEKGKYEMLSLSQVNRPEESNGEVYERLCTCCDMVILLRIWLEHVKSHFHQISYKIKLCLLGFCWYKNINKPVHDPSKCVECVHRMQENRNYSDPLENIQEYKQYNDHEFIQMNEDIEDVEKLLNKYTCKVCDIKCHNQEYFDNHLKGKKHRNNTNKRPSTAKDTPST